MFLSISFAALAALELPGANVWGLTDVLNELLRQEFILTKTGLREVSPLLHFLVSKKFALF